MSRNYRRGRKKSTTPYIIGILILVAAAALSIRGVLGHAKDPSAAAVNHQTPSAESSPSNAVPPAISSPDPVSAGGIEYVAVEKPQEEIYKGNLILVNKDHAYKFSDAVKLVNLYDGKASSYKVSDTDIKIGSETLKALNKLFDAFYAQTGVGNTYIISAYRSYDRQQALYQREVAEKGESEAAYWVAKPGTSEHHTGLAVDLGLFDSSGAYHEYDGSGKYSWINQSCYKYGFVVRYREDKKNITYIAYEPWHFRYLGIPHATQLSKLKLSLEEYIELLRSYSYDKPLKITTDDGSVYNTYFCKGQTVYVPKNGDYELSGNNVDGFIVTLKVS